jgi:hypothetical protein
VDGSPLILDVDIDITEQRRAEEQKRRRIAVILREDLQQQIAGAKFRLSMVRGKGSTFRIMIPDGSQGKNGEKMTKGMALVPAAAGTVPSLNGALFRRDAVLTPPQEGATVEGLTIDAPVAQQDRASVS